MDQNTDDHPAIEQHDPASSRGQTPVRSPFLFALLTALPVGLAVALIGTTMNAHYRDQMQAEMKDYGLQRILDISELGRRIYQDFQDPKIGDGDANQYQTTKEAQAIRKRLLLITAADPDIRAFGLYASNKPTANPRGEVLAMGQPIGDWAPNASMVSGVGTWRGTWRDQGVDEEVLFLRAPIAGSGNQLTAVAHLVLSVESFERKANAVTKWILVLGVVFITLSFGLAFLWASATRRRSAPNSTDETTSSQAAA